ncbi:Las1-like-domain-containing protein [Phakopsora pachyrhizi]|uniref:Las1-like-domain-containing protein n=1 Tax=Phakopsora pachyrhizi TaxID=170000 RepID=A0AAV0ACN6_PHAPC|nr:Las1-like-domain-containing protein [Phakopsora pachyrhizi]
MVINRFRRLPWADSQEFIDVFQLLFNSSAESDQNLRIGLNHLYAWSIRFPSELPPAIESTHSLLRVLSSYHRSIHQTDSIHQSRLALAMALIRFVNGLVDQLQTGLYARSLSQIANQIGLPLSFVQIRHRATHEDLPSHSILVDSAKMALDWLYNNYWAPTVNEMNGTQSLPDSKGTSHQQQEERLVELLRHYKRLRKRSLIDQTDKEFIRLQSQISDWIRITTKSFIELGISNNRVYSKFLAGKAVDDDEVVVDFEEEMEIRSLNVLCKVLCQSDFFVPKSLLKRNQLINSFLLPRHLKELYEPLINFIDQLYSKRASISFKKLLISKILEIILVDRVKTIEQLRFHKTHRAVDEQDKGLDGGGSSSYVFTISAWLVSILNGLDQFGNGCEPEDNEIQQESLRDHVLKQLILKPNPFNDLLIETYNQLF